jgi:tRNA-specific 2-thiouridylase
LGIPFYVWDFSEAFHTDVVEDFLAEYRAGRTPNPCLRCNEKIKFAALSQRALSLGFDGVVTGHYARLVTGPDGAVELHRGIDQTKDQSYVLGVMTQEQLCHAYFPLGDSIKTDVRAEAEARGLRTAHKPDSYDICFIPEGDTAEYLHDKLGYAPGDIVDEQGEILGSHQGTFTYTIGQRRGLGLGRPAPDGRPRYVVDLNPETRKVVVGGYDALRIDRLTGIKPLWCEDTRPTEDTSDDKSDKMDNGMEVTAQVRAHAREVPATLSITPEGVAAELHEPVYGVAPGQTVVFYQGTRVLGSATINTTA